MLRGINVSGQKKIIMKDLAALYESQGLTQVNTYIQSGNVVFHASVTKQVTLAKKISGAINSAYGFEVVVFVRDREQMAKTLKKNPFLDLKDVDISKLYVTFLEQAPEKGLVKKLEAVDAGVDRCKVIGNDVYLYCPGGSGKSRLSNNFIEKQLQLDGTTRNWKTVNVLHEMLVP
jgi:uncharacterized protein (DUF1697 family)